MELNQDTPKTLTAEVIHLRALAASVKAHLALEIARMPDNPDISRINSLANCFTMNASVMMKEGKLSPEYYDWLYQYRKVLDKVNDTEATKLVEILTEATDKGFIMFNKEKVLLHPKVIDKIKSLL